MVNSPDFIHLRTHSSYSLLEGALHLKDLVALAKKYYMPAIALTDSGNLFGALEFATIAASQGVQPIIGCEIKVRRPAQFSQRPNKETTEKGEYDLLVLLVQSHEGYKNLLKLVSHSFIHLEMGLLPQINFSLLEQYNEGLIALSGGIQGLVGRLIADKNTNDARAAATYLTKLFPGRFYLEITRLGTPQEAAIERGLISIAQEENIPLISTNCVYYDSEETYEAHDILTCVAQGNYVNTPDRQRLPATHYFKSQRAMKSLFKDLPEALENTVIVARRCSFMPECVPPRLPPFPCEEGKTEEEELAEKARQGLFKRLQQVVWTEDMSAAQKKEIQEKYFQRLTHELTIIGRMGFAGYFLIVADFVQWAKSQEIPVGPGRGSGAGSVVAWSLTITDMDPIRFNLLFERFLNPERVSMPDFDIDFCQDRRDEVISYVQKRYGADKVAHIITFGKLQARAVLRDVGRVLQMPYGQIDRLCKLIPNNPASPLSLKEAIAQDSHLQQQVREDGAVRRLMAIGSKLEGLYRHASTHAAGIIIGERPLDQIIPLYRDPKSPMLVTQFNMKYVEEAGLVKFDFLGLKTLTILERACQIVRDHGDPSFSLGKISLENKKAFDLLKRVETCGVFQLEGSGMQEVVRNLQPDRFEEIIALVALYRPGPMDDIPRYIACKHGKEEVRYMHPMLEPILSETFGVMVYQEQVMQIAQVMAGYGLGEADLLRRAMGKKIKSEMDAQRKNFIKGAMKNGVDKVIADQIFDQIAKFAGYGFNKSHSAPYALLAYQTAYMKANHPLAFMSATLTYDMHNTDKLNYYRQELTHMKIPLHMPDINVSGVEFCVESPGIRYALAAIKNVGREAMEEVVRERETHGPYKSIWDFSARLSSRVLNKRQMESLIMAGAFDSLHNTRKGMLAALEDIVRYGSSLQDMKNSHQQSLFSQEIISSTTSQQFPCDDEWDELERLQREHEAIGFYLSAHPLQNYQEILTLQGVIPSNQLGQYNGRIVKVAGMIMALQERTSRQGNRFAFLSLSDEVGAYECTLFSDILASARSFLEMGTPMVLDVLVRVEEGEQIRLTAQKLSPLKATHMPDETMLFLTLSSEEAYGALHDFLQRLDTGKSKIFCQLSTPLGKTTVLLPQTYALPLGIAKKLRCLPGISNVELTVSGPQKTGASAA